MIEDAVELDNGREQLFLISTPAVIGENYSLVLMPNQTREVNIDITNPTEVDLAVKSSLNDFVMDGSYLGLSEWSSFQSQEYTLKAGETKGLVVDISPPKSVVGGGYYALVTHDFRIAQEEASESAHTNQTGTIIYVLVSAEGNEELVIESFGVDRFWERGPVEYGLVLQNLTHYHLWPQGKVTLTNRRGQVVDESMVGMEHEIPPSTAQTYQGELNVARNWGKFKATLEIVYGYNNDQVMVAESEFWVLPLRLILLGFLCLIVGVALICKKIRG
ncbi:DUF916 domain-containing protein [Microgenomates group bacterium]|nr:DUF916 domain-containing protein [Microgenomates group bacterium]